MSTNYIDAKDEIFKMLTDAWDASSGAIVSYVPEIQFHGLEKHGDPEADKYFAVAILHVVGEGQKTLCNNVDSLGQKRYNNRGLFEFQINCPLSDPQNSEKGALLGIVARDAFRGKESSCGIVFDDAVVKPFPSTDVFSKHIMTVKYNYDEVSL